MSKVSFKDILNNPNTVIYAILAYYFMFVGLVDLCIGGINVVREKPLISEELANTVAIAYSFTCVPFVIIIDSGWHKLIKSKKIKKSIGYFIFIVAFTLGHLAAKYISLQQSLLIATIMPIFIGIKQMTSVYKMESEKLIKVVIYLFLVVILLLILLCPDQSVKFMNDTSGRGMTILGLGITILLLAKDRYNK
ncbi:hypothetical protein AB1I77_27825 [Bacillus paranthracis]|uniref:hypothetical protein n=1 Tax=Bacillales TaxID=1385 RepID=UPI0009779297|nr:MULTISPECIES: hypothetical protein [Bacillales]ONG66385.1 hypothetical protein BKK43_28085 [Bacillus cereus]MBK3313364.1 hypothetical protein [Staphylococcus aureus]MDA2666749.1 hypothetical protein [Bacillus cereus group sp. Bc032]MDA2677459.1 hypothetical protein [Bacillus cereus group sp. Bc031]MDA2682957.1 hypothetical protein [Bacillus cereus group sp. Bc029]